MDFKKSVVKFRADVKPKTKNIWYEAETMYNYNKTNRNLRQE